MAEQVTMMVLKVDLQCSKCSKKVKKVLCKIPEIRDQVYDEKKNTVTIKVVCSCPEEIKRKIYRKGGKSIKCIEIIKPPPQKPQTPEKKPNKPEEKPKTPEEKKPKEPPTPPPCNHLCYCRPPCYDCYCGRPCKQLGCCRPPCYDCYCGRPCKLSVYCKPPCYDCYCGRPCKQLGYCRPPCFDYSGCDVENPSACTIM